MRPGKRRAKRALSERQGSVPDCGSRAVWVAWMVDPLGRPTRIPLLTGTRFLQRGAWQDEMTGVAGVENGVGGASGN